MREENLYSAIVTKLQADTGSGSLVALTGHTGSNIRIARFRPKQLPSLPFLGIWIADTSRAIEDGPGVIYSSLVFFTSYSKDDLTSIKLSDRIQVMLESAEKSGTSNRGFLDFSDSKICNYSTRFLGREPKDYNDERDVWNLLIQASVVWSSKV
jgi:hypothetical protein